ncbi:hypothetical protein EJ04DRAFT_557315 [Polyplosphaeria fusca]|uniref:Zn(2)-C6 fungal-type domain-containing protein n=1 Tax=Polyplosphaeria fusca TaxID=682080 RepID=A0A9P4QJC9_9PLEO|nr:hypothetical protein EJ04DRAFT_557315 [Polyplosphaeria fusca]
MTQTGKCDTCRARKVKCDEKKPKCGACRKKDRACTYTYAKVKSLVIEDPNTFSRHGKAKVAPIVYPLVSYKGNAEIWEQNTSQSPSSLNENEFDEDEGSDDHKSRKRMASLRLVPTRRALELWSPGRLYRPSSRQDILAARFTGMIAPLRMDVNPLSVHGPWMLSIPSRIGTSPVLDTAIEFLLNSFDNFRSTSHTKQVVARTSKARALKDLRAVVEAGDGTMSEVLLLSTMVHFSAEIYMGVGSADWTFHAFALALMLRQGNAAAIEDNLFWSLVDNCYMEEMSEAIMEARTSLFDTEIYRNLSAPTTQIEGAPDADFARASRTIMHVMIQLPRLVLCVRRAISAPLQGSTIDAAVELAKSLWDVCPDDLIRQILEKHTMVAPMAPSPEIADIIPESICFDSISSITLIAKYWRLRIHLCTLLQTLHQYFPIQSLAVGLPDLAFVHQEDMKTATQLAQSLTSALSFSTTLPLVPLRILACLQTSVGTWTRIIRRADGLVPPTQAATNVATTKHPHPNPHGPLNVERAPNLNPRVEVGELFMKIRNHAEGYENAAFVWKLPVQTHVTFPSAAPDEVERAIRMRDWVMEYTNRIHDSWNIERAEPENIQLVLDISAGAPIPAWVTRWIDGFKMGLNGLELLEYVGLGSVGHPPAVA